MKTKSNKKGNGSLSKEELAESKQDVNAPGSPGIPATWTSSAKAGIGKAMKATSDVSFTLGHGIVNEVYYPWEDEACIRDMGFLVTNGKDFFSDERNDTDHVVKTSSPGIPAYTLTNICKQQRYRLEKEIISDPIRNTVLHQVRFRALKGKLTDYNLYVQVAPHLAHQGAGNTAWVEDYKGVPMLFAIRNDRAVALVCSVPWLKRSVGYVGFSDGWQDLNQHKKMEWEYARAEDGNVAMTAQIDMERTEGKFVLALGFGHNMYEAAYAARGSMLAGYKEIRKVYVGEWRNWQKTLSSAKSKESIGKFFRMSASVLRIHEANRVPGAIIASMSIPWGEARGDKDNAGYHMVWPRDLVESSGGLLALHAKEDTLRILTYLMTTQEGDGHWMQNMWLQGKPHWKGVQMDQTALPVLLMDLFKHHGVLKQDKIHRYWITVKNALSYLIQHGPYTEQDRWERDGGLSIFTVATEIAALLAGADFAEGNNEPEIAAYCRETADCWNGHVEDWFYVNGSDMAHHAGVEGYYIRLNPFEMPTRHVREQYISVKNHSEETSNMPMNEMVSPDALALVRFGLRAPDDPKILNTIKVIDQVLKVETPCGDCWHRYNKDGYGEHEDGRPYDGTGIGRAWPLLTGERAHYEIAAGNLERARELAKDMENFAHNGLFPEQIWDTDDIPEYGLYFGRPSNGAMPLVWAHAEYIKLSISLKQKEVFDMPEQTQERYIRKKTLAVLDIWQPGHPILTIRKGLSLRIEICKPALIHWSMNSWKDAEDIVTRDSGLGVYYADLKAAGEEYESFLFTFYWDEEKRWEGKNFEVKIK
jgi:glucoamylase